MKFFIYVMVIGSALLFPSRVSAHSAHTDVVIPDSLEQKVSKLTDEKRAFLVSDKALNFAARHELLFKRLEGKSVEEIDAYVEAMMQVVEQLRFQADKDMAAIPLNTDSDSFNYWKTKRPAAMDTPREPGPINVQRYIWSHSKMGIPTFFHMPVALTPEDLIAGEVDVAVVGIPLDTASGMRGAAYGPRAVRTGHVYSGMGFVEPEHMHTMVSPFNELVIVDYGDIAVDMLSSERSMGHIREMVAEIAKTGTIPMIVGGDHSLMYPDVAGIVDVYGKGKVGVIHFDAHYDAGVGSAHLISHGRPVRRLFEEDLVPGKNFIQIGLRGYWPSAKGFEWMQKEGLRYHTMAEIEKHGWEKTMKRVMAEALEGPEYLYVSFDIDVLDPAYTPGTGTPEPNGLTPREVFPI